MKKLTLLLALLPGLLMAQNPEKAKEILDKVTAKTKTYNTIQAEFSFALENLQEDIKDEYQGKISIKGDKYKANVMGAETYFNGKTQWTYMIDSKEVNVDEPDPNDEESLNPASIFTIYQKGFNFAYLGEKQSDGITVIAIDLFPENRDKQYSRIKLEFNKDNLDLHKVVSIGKDGNNYTIVVKSMKTNVPMDDSMFVFDTSKHPDVEVVDMR